MKWRVSESWQFVAGSYFSFLFFPLFAAGVIYGGVLWLLPALLVMVVVPLLDSPSHEDGTVGGSELSTAQKWLTEAAPALFVLGNAAVIGVTAHVFARLGIAEKFFFGDISRHDWEHRHNGSA
jgi:ABC-type spermidine/putrescine transport system permease subunit I